MENSNITELSLLLIGMCTVFLILGIIYLSGNLLIFLTNKFDNNSIDKEADDHDQNVDIAVITAAVASLSGGKAHIKSIDPIKN